MRRYTHSASTEYGPDEEHIYVGETAEPVSHRLFAALDECTDVDLRSGHPLGYVIDLDAIDGLYASYEGETQTPPPVLTFGFRDYAVTVETPQEIRIVRLRPDTA